MAKNKVSNPSPTSRPRGTATDRRGPGGAMGGGFGGGMGGAKGRGVKNGKPGR